MKTFKTYSTIICVCLLRKFFIFDIPGVSGDGSDWALAPSPHLPLAGSLQGGRVRPEPACPSPGLGAMSPSLSQRLLDPGVSP